MKDFNWLPFFSACDILSGSQHFNGKAGMRTRSDLLIVIYLTMSLLGGQALAKEPPFDVKDVRQVRHLLSINPGDRWRKDYQYLLYMGEKVFPAYEAILSDPKTIGDGAVFGTIEFVEADRRRFIKYALPLLRHKNAHERHGAAAFLEQVGSIAQASAVVPLLSNEEAHVIFGAARTLAAIGGPKELAAMDLWLRGDRYRNDIESGVRKNVQKYRDELKRRLDEDRDPKKRALEMPQYWKTLRITEWENHFVVNYAIRDLTAFGNETVAFLKEHVHPIPTAKQKHLEQLLADLDSDSFDRRETATRELSRGVIADPILEKVLATHPSLELRRRLDTILEDMFYWKSKNPELLRQLRAVWVLQQIGTPEAKALLEKVAAGAPSARLTQKAKDALQSLKRPQKR